jgi:hypothetical protein
MYVKEWEFSITCNATVMWCQCVNNRSKREGEGEGQREKERQRKRDRQRKRETDRERETEREKERERGREREKEREGERTKGREVCVHLPCGASPRPRSRRRGVCWRDTGCPASSPLSCCGGISHPAQIHNNKVKK